MKPFLEALDERVLICDGAMGTMLYAKGIFLNRCFDELNLTQPDLVADVHQAYLRAGADIIETNTFGANRVKLATFGLAERARADQRAGGADRAHAAREQAYVAGAIGPLGIRVEPWGKTGLDEAEAAFREQAEALAEGGVDLFMLETFRDLSELGAAVRAVRAVSPLPDRRAADDRRGRPHADGTPPEQFTPVLADARRRRDRPQLQRRPGRDARDDRADGRGRRRRGSSAQPNAGRPRDVEGRNIYLSSPEYMASYARRFVGAGRAPRRRLLRHDAGTRPPHPRWRRARWRPACRPGRSKAAAPPCRAASRRSPPVPRAEKSRLANALARGQFVIAVELAPPRGYACHDLIEQARDSKIRGVDVVLVADRQRAART